MMTVIIDDHLNGKTERRRTIGSMESQVSQTEDQNVSRVPSEHNTALLLQIEQVGKNIFEAAFIKRQAPFRKPTWWKKADFELINPLRCSPVT